MNEIYSKGPSLVGHWGMESLTLPACVNLAVYLHSSRTWGSQQGELLNAHTAHRQGGNCVPDRMISKYQELWYVIHMKDGMGENGDRTIREWWQSLFWVKILWWLWWGSQWEWCPFNHYLFRNRFPFISQHLALLMEPLCMEQLLLEGRICHAVISLHTKHKAWKKPFYASEAKS